MTEYMLFWLLQSAGTLLPGVINDPAGQDFTNRKTGC
jgi:hypothetical protein